MKEGKGEGKNDFIVFARFGRKVGSRVEQPKLPLSCPLSRSLAASSLPLVVAVAVASRCCPKICIIFIEMDSTNEDRRIVRKRKHNNRIMCCLVASVAGICVARLHQLRLLLNSSYEDKPLADSDYEALMENVNLLLHELVNCMKLMVQQQNHDNEAKKNKRETVEQEKEKEKEMEKEKEKELQKIYEELYKIGLPQHQLVRAYVLLGRNKDKARLFFSTPEVIRLAVLDELLDMSDK